MRKMNNRQNKTAEFNFKDKKRVILKKTTKRGKRLNSNGR